MQEFKFTVTFFDNGTYEYSIDSPDDPVPGDPVFLTSGGMLKLKHGQKAVFAALPVGVLYTVNEPPVNGYIISSTGHHGNIMEAGNTAEFTNTLDTIVPGDTKIQITKMIKGNPPEADKGKEFEFTLTVVFLNHEHDHRGKTIVTYINYIFVLILYYYSK